MSNDYLSLRVLIVDEDDFTRTLLKAVLEDLGFRNENIYRCGDGQEALDLLRSKKVDFVMCDWRMEPMDGITFLRKLRDPKDSPAPGIPVIFCSSQLDQALVEKIREIGVNEAIIKPITINAIQSRIRAILERPRPLIMIQDYVGPDRRRVDNGEKPCDRRVSLQEPDS